MTVECKLDAYEVDGSDKFENGAMTVKSHWNRDSMVVIRIGKGKPITVRADQLQRAVQNATNHK